MLNIWERIPVYLRRQQGILKPYKVFPEHLCPNFMLSLGAIVCCSQIECEEMLAQNSEQSVISEERAEASTHLWGWVPGRFGILSGGPS